MATVIVHATLTLDGFLAEPDGGVDWMFGRPSAPEDDSVVERVTSQIGAVVGGANRSQTIEDDELPYGGMLRVPVYLMTHSHHAPIERDGTIYTFVVDDITDAVTLAAHAAGEKWVSLLGGGISRQCLRFGLVDELHLHVAPVLLGEGVSLFAGLGQHIELERLETSAYASEAHLRYRVLR